MAPILIWFPGTWILIFKSGVSFKGATFFSGDGLFQVINRS